MRPIAAVPLAAMLASFAVIDVHDADRRTASANCQCTVEIVEGGTGPSTTCGADGADCVKVTAINRTPAQNGLCQEGSFCTAPPRGCVSEKRRFKVEYRTDCPPTTCCPQDVAQILVDGSSVGNLARGQSQEVDVGGIEFPCGTGRLDVMSVQCLNANGQPGTVLVKYDRVFLCNPCTP